MTPLDSQEAVAVSVTYCSECQTTTYAVCSEHGDEHLKIVEAYSVAAVRPVVDALKCLTNAIYFLAYDDEGDWISGPSPQGRADMLKLANDALAGLQPQKETE